MPKLINYPHLASMAFGQPLYATQDVLAGVKSLLLPRMLGNQRDIMAADELPDGFEPAPLEAMAESGLPELRDLPLDMPDAEDDTL